jgi:hypothetical protein
MTRLVIQHRKIEAQIKTLQSQLAAIETDPEYLRDLEFAAKLDNLMEQYGKGLTTILSIFDQAFTTPNEPKVHGSRGKPRKPVRYRNPHTNEVVATASGNSKVLRKWKSEYPAERIKDWMIED